METLAVIAWNHPALQADIIKIRHTKAYDHMKQLEETGYVQKVKYGRTFKIKLTQKFFDYFDIPSQNAKDAFKKVIPQEVQERVMQMEEEIEDKEREVEELKRMEADQKEQLAAQIKQEKSQEQEAQEAVEKMEKELGEYDEDTKKSEEGDERMPEVVYACEGDCGGVATQEQHDGGATTCSAEGCTKHGEPLVKRMRCTACKAIYEEGEEHTCA